MGNVDKFVKANWAELKGNNTIDLPGSRYRLAWGSRHCKRQDDYEMLFQLARDRSCVFDVGAKVGVTAMCMAGALKEGTVFAFEASESSCFVVNRNISLNSMENKIVAVNMVVGEKSGLLCEYYWNIVSGRSGIVMAPPHGATPIQKLTVSLDDFVQQNGLQPDLVKIDVEGAEHGVIAGMQRIMRDFAPDIALELHAWPGTTAATNAEGILGLLESVEYGMYWLGNRQFLDHAKVLEGLSESTTGVEARARFLLLPKGRSLPAWLETLDLS